jgi:hypothetical protein
VNERIIGVFNWLRNQKWRVGKEGRSIGFRPITGVIGVVGREVTSDMLASAEFVSENSPI